MGIPNAFLKPTGVSGPRPCAQLPHLKGFVLEFGMVGCQTNTRIHSYLARTFLFPSDEIIVRDKTVLLLIGWNETFIRILSVFNLFLCICERYKIYQS